MRSRRIARLLAAWAIAGAAACSSKVAPETSPAPSAPPVATAGGARTITLETLEASLASRGPSTIVFDIDDTALLTGLAFLNDSLDARFSKPKRIARELIAFHQSRGDTIVFVTSRFPSDPPSDWTSRRPFQPGKYGEEILANSAD
jgi:acid phosphatase (class B)